MTWSKLSDDFSDDCWTLSDAAFRLHVEGIIWSNRKLLDLRIPKDEVQRFAKHPGAVQELLGVGWWTEASDGYLIRHHAAYQRLREDVIRQQEVNRANGRRGGRPRGPGRETNLPTETDSLTDSAQETELVSESPSGSESERDRPGQDRAVEGGTNNETTEPHNPWSDVVVAVPGGSSPPESCTRCGQRLLLRNGRDVCERCRVAAAPTEAVA